MRLLICNDCRTIDELPDFNGKPEDDVLLENLINEQHGAATPEPHAGNLVTIEQRHWENKETRSEILRQIRQGTRGIAETDSDFYDTRDWYTEEAQRCFSAHRRTVPCVDWHDSKKRIGNPVKESKGKVYLCDFCVVASTVLTEKRKAYGAYDAVPKHHSGDIY